MLEGVLVIAMLSVSIVGTQLPDSLIFARVTPQPHLQYQQFKLAMDVHAASVVVVRMIDGARPQPPQTFKRPIFWRGPRSRWLWPKR